MTTRDTALDTWESTSVSSGCSVHGCMSWGVIPCALVCEICSDVHTGACMDICEKDYGMVVSQLARLEFLFHFVTCPSEQPWMSYLNSLCLSFLICEMG